MHFLYKITNQINNKIYIGQTTNPKRRWYHHRYFAKYPNRTNQYIHRAMNKYGKENFLFQIIATCKTKEDANFTENILIDQYGSIDAKIGYNLTKIGNDYIMPEEIKTKISNSMMGNKNGLGHKLSESAKSIISKTQKGRKRTLEQIEKHRKTLIGKKLTEEHKKKISESMKNKYTNKTT